MSDIITKYPKRKMETVIDIEAPAQKIYNVFKETAFHVPGHAPNHIQGVEVHEGAWDKHGSIKVWTYTFEGKTTTFKERVEFDDEKLIVKLVGIDGDPFTYLKQYVPIFQFIPKGTGTEAILTIVYEKISESIKVPDYMDFMIGLTKSLSEGIVKS
ncbi:MLP-like protein 28 [Tripterygium wilfordii]|uniref:MLP-like protein 28 n=1 Tax=Tripterygium wilfordii TaxID=458696 RepID=A0A7J7C0I4_TRIWF|nr:MLP-like protein 328 [Tripterygium wilfordii]KAF5727670.1 MLP-like protein 28 [Tripterygium wilfordii]